MKCRKYLAIALVGLIILVSGCIPAANSAERGGKSAEAERAYKEAIKRNPNDAKTHYYLGALFQETGRLEEAEKYFEKAKRLDPGIMNRYR